MKQGQKWPQFSVLHCVHCFCKLSPLQHEREPISALCAPACILPLQHASYAYTQRGLSLLHIPATCPLGCVNLNVYFPMFSEINVWDFFPGIFTTSEIGLKIFKMLEDFTEILQILILGIGGKTTSWDFFPFSFPIVSPGGSCLHFSPLKVHFELWSPNDRSSYGKQKSSKSVKDTLAGIYA